MYEFVWTIGKGVLVGLGASIVGYAKSLPSGESLDWMKATPTLVIGAIVGAVSAYKGIGLDSAEALIASFGIVFLANSLWSTFLKWKNKPKPLPTTTTVKVKR